MPLQFYHSSRRDKSKKSVVIGVIRCLILYVFRILCEKYVFHSPARFAHNETEMKISFSNIWVKIGLGLFVFILILIGLRLLLWWKVHQEINALRERGIATTATEFIAQLPRIPDEQNAAVQTIRAYNSIHFEPASLFRDRNFTLNILDEFNYFKNPTPSPEVLEQVGEFLALNEKQFEKIHATRQLSNSLLPIDYSEGFLSTDLGPALTLRQLANSYRIIIIHHAKKGENGQSVKYLSDSIHLNLLLKNEKHIMPQLVRIAINSISIITLLDTLHRTQLSDTELSQLQNEIQMSQSSLWITDVYKSELTMACDLFWRHPDFLYALYSPDFLSTSSSPPSTMLFTEWLIYHTKISLQKCLNFLLNALGLWNLNLLKTVEVYNKLIEASTLPYPKQLKELEMIEEETLKLPFIYAMPKLLIPAVSKSCIRHQIDIAQTRTAETALAVERYRLKHQKLPDSLEQLAPKFIESVPLDPFDGKPLRYRRDGKSFYVYSIGNNLTDDGGYPSKAKSGTKGIHGEDIVFFIERP